MFEKTLADTLNTYGITLEAEKLKKLHGYFKLLLDANRTLNLTRITDPDDAALRHFADSVALLSAVDVAEGARVIDVGTGGGFPGVPLLIARPDLRMTLIDSTGKKLAFVRSACEELKLPCEILTARAEELSGSAGYRDGYDLAVSRAVAALPVLTELCAPFVKPGGIFAAYKGERAQEELSASAGAIRELKLKYGGMRKTPGGRLLVFFKTAGTPEGYPREYRKIAARPL